MEILDATLREGEQRSGRSYPVDAKVEAAGLLDDLGVDVVQVGFPVADDDVGAVCDRLDIGAETCGIARAVDGDIDAAAEAGVDIVKVSVPSSDLQRERVLGMGPEETKALLAEKLDYARDRGLEARPGTIDGFRTDPAYLNELIDAVDAEYFTISDSVGARTPDGVTSLLDELDCDLSTVSVHFHDDLGVGTANALAAARAGVGSVDVTVGGVGERVGNVPLEEFVVAAALADDPIPTNVATERLIPATREVLSVLGEEVPAHKPILGETAYAHESGMHTAAMLDEPATFEPFDPGRFGGSRRLLFGPASGRGAARRLLERADREPTDERIEALLGRLGSLDEHVPLEEAVGMARAIR